MIRATRIPWPELGRYGGDRPPLIPHPHGPYMPLLDCPGADAVRPVGRFGCAPLATDALSDPAQGGRAHVEALHGLLQTAGSAERFSTVAAQSVELAAAILFIVLAVVVATVPGRNSPGRTRWRQAAAYSVQRWTARLRAPTPGQAAIALGLGASAALLAGGVNGIPIGVAVALISLGISARRVAEQDVRAQHRLTAAAPAAADLFAASLAAGLLPADAASVVATAYDRSGGGGPPSPRTQIASRYAAASAALREGCEPETAWRFLTVDPATAAVGAAALRSSRTGAPAAATVARAARESWTAAELAAQADIRAAGVRATAPLALCFLPAFVLVGVVPTALGLVAGLQT